MEKYTRTLLIIAILSFLLIGWLGATKYTTNKKLKNYQKLVTAEGLFIEQDFEEAFRLYQELPKSFYSTEFLNIREKIANTKGYDKEEGGHKLSSEVFFSEHIRSKVKERIKECKKGGKHIENYSDLELLTIFMDCYNLKGENILSKSQKLENNSNSGFLTFKNKKDQQVYFLGDLVDSLANGFGIGLYSNENYYKGSWKNNKRHGEGLFMTKNGAFYKGRYEFDERNGFGEYHFRNGDFYSGYWKDGKRDSIGTVFSPQGDTIVFGIWENDRLNRKKTRAILKNGGDIDEYASKED